MSKKTKSRSKKPSKAKMSDKTKYTLIVLASAVLVIGGGVWAYQTFTTVPPPVLDKSETGEVIDFLGNARGLPRMSVHKRYDYLVRTYQHYSKGPQRDQFARRLREMSRGQKQVLLNASFDIARVSFMDNAKQYNKIRDKKRRSKFLDNAIRNFEGMRAELGGGGGSPSGDLGSPFKDDLPKSSDDLMKVVLSRTSPHDRATAKPFIEAVAGRAEELRQSQARK